MARALISITKSTPFQGKVEEFSNVYCYEIPDTTEARLESMITKIVSAEKAVHANDVTFVRAQAWDVGTPPNLMRASETLSGTGSQTAQTTFFKECAYLIQWPLPRSLGLLRSTHRSLKKWLHTCRGFGAGDLKGTTQYGSFGVGDPLFTYAQLVSQMATDDAVLVSPSGAVPNGPPTIYPYLAHRQFPRGRKQ